MRFCYTGHMKEEKIKQVLDLLSEEAEVLLKESEPLLEEIEKDNIKTSYV